MSLTYLDFFAGIGGFRSGFDSIGAKCLGFAEIDKYARQSYKAIHDVDGEKEWHDITQVTDAEFGELAGKVDLINAGFPCQAFSVAGKRKGFEDSRGTLFYEVARAAKIIQPKYLLLENVKGLLSHDKGNTVDVIFQTLNEIGYTFDFEVLNSKYFGVPQNRERIFILAVRDDLVKKEEWDIKGNGVVAKAKKRFKAYEGIKSFNFFGWTKDFDTIEKKLRDVIELDVDEKYYLSEDKTSKIINLLREEDQAEVVAVKGDLISRNNPESQYGFSKTDWFTLRCAETHGVAHIIPKTQVVANLNHWSMDIMNRVYGVDGLSPTIHTMQGGGREPKIAAPPNYRIRKLTPLECWKLQGFSENQHKMAVEAGLSNSQRYKQSGNSVTVNVVDAVAKELMLLHTKLKEESLVLV